MTRARARGRNHALRSPQAISTRPVNFETRGACTDLPVGGAVPLRLEFEDVPGLRIQSLTKCFQ